MSSCGGLTSRFVISSEVGTVPAISTNHDKLAAFWPREPGPRGFASGPGAWSFARQESLISMFLFVLTTILSAFLLFQIQPMIAKIILPWFGGSAAVWTVCLLFFQVGLLLGYLYANWLDRHFRPRVQALIHGALLLGSLFLLPILPNPAWKPTAWTDPTFRILGLLAVTVGLPYFLLSSTSPLLQSWYARTRRSATPYWLYAVSNGGSMLALLSYPIVMEPLFSNRTQALAWSGAYAGFAILCVFVAFQQSKRQASATSVEEADDPPSRALQFFWIALPACASILLLAVTNHLTQNVAPVPFLWVLPLSLYLLSFILSFSSPRFYHRGVFLQFLAVALASMSYALFPQFLNASWTMRIPLYSVGLFICCMACHGELARLKPAPRYLTQFYALVSLGGACGGIFVGLLAPHLFHAYDELPMGMGICAVLILLLLHSDASSIFYHKHFDVKWLAAVTMTAGLIFSLYVGAHESTGGAVVMERNFYGTLKLLVLDHNDPQKARRQLLNGTINHGEEYLARDKRLIPTTYYAPTTGVGIAIQSLEARGPLRVGVIGLGTGTLAAYARPGDHYTFYEINPLVLKIALEKFDFLTSCKGQVDVSMGDARLSLEGESPRGYDLLVVDAFSGDSIPIHLLTREAFELYFRQLHPNGILAIHISNRFLNLQPVIAQITASLGKPAVLIENSKDESTATLMARWVLTSGDPQVLQAETIAENAMTIKPRPGLKLWTDEYSNLLGVLK
jgi:hypothetical protein